MEEGEGRSTTPLWPWPWSNIDVRSRATGEGEAPMAAQSAARASLMEVEAGVPPLEKIERRWRPQWPPRRRLERPHRR